MMRTFGLIGKKLSHSFSPTFFANKFRQEGIQDAQYLAFELDTIDSFPQLVKARDYKLSGLNVTIPYKEQIIPFLDELDAGARAVGAVNTIAFQNGKMVGYNTDIYGFRASLLASLKKVEISHKKALILGTGGAAKAVEYVLQQLDWQYQYVSRSARPNVWTYEEVAQQQLRNFPLIVNTTPLGMYPNVNTCPNLNYHQLGSNHLLYDLVYNPEETLFLKKGKAQDAHVKNGLEMLHLQALKAWDIWNNV